MIPFEIVRVIRERTAIFILVAAAGVVLTGAELPVHAASSPGAPDTGRGRPATGLVPFAIPVIDPEPSSPASPEWLTEPRLVPRGVSLLARKLTGIPLGVTWTHWGEGRPATCEPFRGQAYSISFEDYWVYRCWEALAGGKLDYFTYLLDERHEPNLERARWSPDTSTGLGAEDVRTIYDALVDTLTQVFGNPATSEISGRGGAYWREKWDFPGQGGVVTTYLVEEPKPMFVIELRSAGLRSAAEGEEEEWIGGEFDDEAQGAQALRRDVAGALRPRWPGLARAVLETPSSIQHVSEVREALTVARRKRLERAEGKEEEHDLVHFGAHLWMLGFDYTSLADTLVRRELESMRPLGVRWEPSHYVDFCYQGSLLDSLVVRAGRNRWTDLAFLSFQEMGWETACDCASGSDQFRPVIERGEAFLKNHPNSTVRHAVALTVAQAHETAWSLAMGRCVAGDIGWNWTDYVLEAPDHREQAIALYEQLLREAPGIPALRSVKQRLPRLKLDVDTNYHHYWCLLD